MTAPVPATRPRLGILLLFGVLAGTAFAAPWWLGSPRALGWAAAGAGAAIPLAWALGLLRRVPAPLGLGLGVFLIHLAAAGAGIAGGLPWIEGLKFLVQGTLLGLAAGVRWRDGALPAPLGVLTVAAPLILTTLARQQVGLEAQEGIRLQGVLAEAIGRGTAFPDSDSVGAHAKVWVIDRGTARIVAAPDGKGGDLDGLGLEHPGRVLTESGGAYATRLGRHAVLAWRAVPGVNDVGVVVLVYEPTSDVAAPLGWELLTLLAVVGMGIVLATPRK
ncbi:MAG TPA: hypothetical protein VG940_13515 [Gemmatimonadales bacterium]|nr:hypothetical protein [Gemmatimonadales bacterium]